MLAREEPPGIRDGGEQHAQDFVRLKSTASVALSGVVPISAMTSWADTVQLTAEAHSMRFWDNPKPAV